MQTIKNPEKSLIKKDVERHAATSIACCPGSCGELFQGRIAGSTIHITCPVNIYSYARVSLGGVKIKVPAKKIKVYRAVELLLKYFDMTGDGIRIELNSDLPPGKGMASSTADIAASLAAVGAIIDREISPRLIASFALAVEPTDGLFFNGITAFDHHFGVVDELIGPAPPLGVIILDFGGVIESSGFASDKIVYSNYELGRLREAFSIIKHGIRSNDLPAIGEGATISARVNQKYLYKAMLEKIISITVSCGAYGVNVAHSGTVIGVLVDNADVDGFHNLFRETFPQANVSIAQIINGGINYFVYGRS